MSIDRLTTCKTFILPLSFVWVLVTCYQLSGFLLSRVLLNVWAVALIIVCEVCISFVVFFFLIDKLQQQGLYNIEFDATPYDESQEVQQPRPPMPRITYQEIYPHGSYTFCSILQPLWLIFWKSACLRWESSWWLPWVQDFGVLVPLLISAREGNSQNSTLPMGLLWKGKFSTGSLWVRRQGSSIRWQMFRHLRFYGMRR